MLLSKLLFNMPNLAQNFNICNMRRSENIRKARKNELEQEWHTLFKIRYR